MATLENLLSQAIVERLGWTLIHFVWQAAAIALLLAIVLKALHKHSASLRYIIACLALMLIVALPLVTMALVEVPEPVAEAGPAPIPMPIMDTTPVEAIEVAELPTMVFDGERVDMADVAVRVPWTQRAVVALEPALPYLVLGWLLGVFGLSAWHLGGWAQLQRMKRRMVCDVATPLRTQLAALSERLGVTRAVGLLESALVEVPTVVGWIKPVILLPASALSGLSTKQLEAILAHELAHIRRYDYLVNIAQTVVEILGFYHPALWWISHKIRDERENCCDDLAVQVCGDSVRYARALTCLEEMRHHAPELAVAASGGSLVARIARLLGRPATDERRFTWLPGLIALLLVALIVIPAALVLAAPNVPPATDNSAPNDLAPTGNEPAVVAKAQTEAEAEGQRGAKILIDCMFAKVLTDKVLDHETVLGIGYVLAGVTSKPGVTLGEILRASVVGKPLAPATIEALVDLLESRGYLKRESRPQIMVFNNKQAEIRTMSEEYFMLSEDPTASPQAIEVGTFVQVTPHFSPAAADRITLEIAAQWTELAAELQTGELPTITRTEIASTVTVPRDRFFALLMEPDDTGSTPRADRESKLVLVRADCVDPPAQRPSASIPPAQQSRSHPRQVLLDARIVVMERTDLLDVGVEWGYPQISAGLFKADDVSGTPWGIQVGYSPDQTFTDSLLMALNLLEENGQAKIVSNPQVLAQDGKVSEIRVMTEEYYMLQPQTTNNAQASNATGEMVTITSGTVLSATPRIGDNNEITLEIAVEYSDSIPAAAGTQLPVVTRRTARNVVTVQNGGTVALAGLTENRSTKRNTDAKEIAIFVTASLAPDNTPPARPEETSVSLPPTVRIDREGERLRGEMVLARKEYVNADPWAQELTQNIVAMERQLIVARQTLASKSPVVIRREKLLDTFKRTLEEKRRELEEEFDAGLIERLEQRRQRLERESSQHPAADTQALAEFVNNDPMVRTLTQTIANMEIDLIVARQDLGAENPEIVQKKRALESLNERLVRRRQELEHLYDTGTIPTVTPDTSARRRANVEEAYRIIREELARAEEEIREVRARWYPEEEEYEELARLLSEQIVTLDESEARPSSMGVGRAEQPRFLHTDVNGQIDREFGFEELIHSEDDRWIVANPWMRLFSGNVRCHITADGGWTRLETGAGFAQPTPGDTTFSANVAIEIAPDEPNGAATCVLYLDDLTYDAEKGCLSSSGAVRFVCGGTEFIGRGLELFCGPAPTRPSGAPVKTIDGVNLYLGPSNSFVVVLGDGQPKPAAAPGPVTATFVERDLLEVLTEIAQRTGEKIGVDQTVKSEPITAELTGATVGNALQTVLAGTGYAFKKTGDTYLIFRPVTATFQGEDLCEALLEIGEQAGANIICDANISGEVYAELREVTLETALRTILAGSPYLLQVKPDAYLITEPGAQTANLDLAPARVYSPVAATFSGMDLSRALEEVAAMAGANLMYDANLSGEVWARLGDMPLEKALETMLAGSPYIARPMPDGYAITKRRTPPAQPSSEKKNEIQIEARFLYVGAALMDALQQGLPIEGVTSDEDIEALHALGEAMSNEKWIALDDVQTQLLLRAIQSSAESKSLASPRVTVLAGESTEMSLSEEVSYTAGYDEPNDSSGEPVARQDTIRRGLALEIEPSLVSEDQIALDGSVTLTRLEGFEERTYRNEHTYQVPRLDEWEVLIEDVRLGTGQTAQLLGPVVRWPWDKEGSPATEEAQSLLILIKATKTQVDEDESEMPFIPTDPAPLPGGMGGFAPGQSPLPPAELERVRD
jgi:type II secretory pathway component GspD/PulD (secretin)/beta-lactamase regulating signal transducer with metallopeptidase domain